MVYLNPVCSRIRPFSYSGLTFSYYYRSDRIPKSNEFTGGIKCHPEETGGARRHDSLMSLRYHVNCASFCYSFVSFELVFLSLLFFPFFYNHIPYSSSIRSPNSAKRSIFGKGQDVREVRHDEV